MKRKAVAARVVFPQRPLVLVLALAALALLASLSLARAATNPAETFVEQNINRGFTILNDTKANPEQRKEQFRNFLLSIADMRRIAMFTLGSYTRGASQGDVEKFVAAFTEFASAVYEHNLEKYQGQTLRVTGSTARSNDDHIVNTEVIDASGRPANIRAAFRVRSDTGKSVVTDIQVEGAWLAIGQRADFTSFLQNNGGSIPALISELQRQTVAMRSGTTP